MPSFYTKIFSLLMLIAGAAYGMQNNSDLTTHNVQATRALDTTTRETQQSKKAKDSEWWQKAKNSFADWFEFLNDDDQHSKRSTKSGKQDIRVANVSTVKKESDISLNNDATNDEKNKTPANENEKQAQNREDQKLAQALRTLNQQKQRRAFKVWQHHITQQKIKNRENEQKAVAFDLKHLQQHALTQWKTKVKNRLKSKNSDDVNESFEIFIPDIMSTLKICRDDIIRNINQFPEDVRDQLLLLAVKAAAKGIVKLLLANPTYKKLINAVDSEGFTALTHAAIDGSLDIAHMLIAVDGINLNARDLQGATPLIRSIINTLSPDISKVQQHRAVTQLLLARGADVNITNKAGSSPLYYAIHINDPALVQTLVYDYHAELKVKFKTSEPIDNFLQVAKIAISRDLLDPDCPQKEKEENNKTIIEILACALEEQKAMQHQESAIQKDQTKKANDQKEATGIDSTYNTELITLSLMDNFTKITAILQYPQMIQKTNSFTKIAARNLLEREGILLIEAIKKDEQFAHHIHYRLAGKTDAITNNDRLKLFIQLSGQLVMPKPPHMPLKLILQAIESGMGNIHRDSINKVSDEHMLEFYQKFHSQAATKQQSWNKILEKTKVAIIEESLHEVRALEKQMNQNPNVSFRPLISFLEEALALKTKMNSQTSSAKAASLCSTIDAARRGKQADVKDHHNVAPKREKIAIAGWHTLPNTREQIAYAISNGKKVFVDYAGRILPVGLYFWRSKKGETLSNPKGKRRQALYTVYNDQPDRAFIWSPRLGTYVSWHRINGKMRAQQYRGISSEASDFIQACEEGNVEKVKALLRFDSIKTSMAQHDSVHMTGLHYAVARDHLPVVQLLLEAGADPNCRNSSDQTPILNALSQNANQKMLTLLLQHKADVNSMITKSAPITPLIYAVVLNDLASVKFLLNNKADITMKSAQGGTALKHAKSTLKDRSLLDGLRKMQPQLTLKKIKKDNALIIEALEQAELKLAKVASATTAKEEQKKGQNCSTDQNQKSEASCQASILDFLTACREGNVDKVKALLRLDSIKKSIEQRDNFHTIGLLHAVNLNHLSVVQLLLEAGADPNCRSGSHPTPIIHAIGNFYHNQKMLTLLIQHKADVNSPATANFGAPLHMAAATNDLVAVRILLNNKADVTIKSNKGLTALQHANTILNDQSLLDRLGKLESQLTLRQIKEDNDLMIAALKQAALEQKQATRQQKRVSVSEQKQRYEACAKQLNKIKLRSIFMQWKQHVMSQKTKRSEDLLKAQAFDTKRIMRNTWQRINKQKNEKVKAREASQKKYAAIKMADECLAQRHMMRLASPVIYAHHDNQGTTTAYVKQTYNLAQTSSKKYEAVCQNHQLLPCTPVICVAAGHTALKIAEKAWESHGRPLLNFFIDKKNRFLIDQHKKSTILTWFLDHLNSTTKQCSLCPQLGKNMTLQEIGELCLAQRGFMKYCHSCAKYCTDI